MCTRNRARQLRHVLDSFVALRAPEGATWEMIVVDNGSTDETSAVIEAFADRLPLRRVWQPVAGLSNARNAGVAAAKGDYICWTDDDVELDPDWLAAYARAFQRYPDGTIFGGIVEPVYEIEPPAWMVENSGMLAVAFAKRDHGAIEGQLPTEQDLLPFGANFAVRAAEQRKFLYDANLGVSPNQKRLGEESAVLMAIAALGGSYYWIPSSRVRHLIPASRMSLEYIEVYYHSSGETWAYLSENDGFPIMGQAIPTEGARIFGVPIWLWCRSLRPAVAYKIKKTLKPRAVHWWLWNFTQKCKMRGARDYFRRAE
nr:glycosyltransferase [Aurantiacibacter xanthus]